MGAGRLHIQSLRDFFCDNVNFEAKPSEVVGEEGDPYFDVGPGLKNKFAVVYIEDAE